MHDPMSDCDSLLECFPPCFRWGVATSALQIEGAAARDQRGPCIWDQFCRRPGAIADGSNADTACDHVRRYRDDVRLMSSLGLGAYRFSISWPRVMPTGQGRVNPTGLDFYDALVDELLTAGIEPVATLYHWDLPQSLQEEMTGWLHDDLPLLFADYAQLIFDRLGDRVTSWITINEPWCIVDGGYFNGAHPPGLTDRRAGYRAAHNLLRAHAYAVARYRSSRYNTGQITFALNTHYSFAHSNDPQDRDAAQRAMLNFAGWFADPAHFGDYPAVLRERLGDLLPVFSTGDQTLLAGSMDYVALNYYLSDVIRHAPGQGEMEYEPVAQPHRLHTEMGWPVVPDGLTHILLWLHERYDQLPIHVTENGAAFADHPDDTGRVNDPQRITYLRDHLHAVAGALERGVDVRGYHVWTLMDNFEWSHGYTKKFGIVRCDFDTLERTIKQSGHWYADLVRRHRQLTAQRPVEETA